MIRKYFLGGGVSSDDWNKRAIDRNGKQTDQCAAAVYGAMASMGIDVSKIWGNANQVIDKAFDGKYPYIINGYEGLDMKPGLAAKDINRIHNLAAGRVGVNFDSSKLDKGSVYLVNLKYNGSPKTVEFYNDSVNSSIYDTYGTHLGLLYWNNGWYIYHNVHGKVGNINFDRKMSSQRKYGESLMNNKASLDDNVENNFILSISQPIPAPVKK